MSAEKLREAATLMRSRAKAATPGPWTGGSKASCYDFGCDDPQRPDDGRCVGVEISAPSQRSWLSGARHHDVERATADGEHVASWHPTVVLAVADWLDAVAAAKGLPVPPGMPTDKGERWSSSAGPWAIPPNVEHAALTMARAYLGETA